MRGTKGRLALVALPESNGGLAPAKNEPRKNEVAFFVACIITYSMKPASHRVCWGDVAVALAMVLSLLVLAGCASDKRTFRAEEHSKFKRLKSSAEAGNAQAQHDLGLIYLESYPHNYDEAARWFHWAADQGNADAKCHLGMMYANGQGVPQDYKEALKWFHQGAQMGNAEAQYHLGVAYGSGQDFQHSYVEAYKWYALAAAQGHELAINARDNIARKLTREQLDDGQRKAAEFAATMNAEPTAQAPTPPSAQTTTLSPASPDMEATANVAREQVRQKIEELNKEANTAAPAKEP